MSEGEILFLVMVVGAFAVFAVTLALTARQNR
jgi:hypothetical protein